MFETPKISGSADGEKTILVADDETHILNVVSLKLRGAGYRVLTACDGQEALDIAVREHPDLLITDYHMPMLSGLELCRRLKQDPATSGIPAIMLFVDGAPALRFAGYVPTGRLVRAVERYLATRSVFCPDAAR